jgi:hypothetical protein
VLLQQINFITFSFLAALTDFRFDVAQPIPLRFELKCMKDSIWYAVNGSESDIIASEVCCVWTQ